LTDLATSVLRRHLTPYVAREACRKGSLGEICHRHHVPADLGEFYESQGPAMKHGAGGELAND